MNAYPKMAAMNGPDRFSLAFKRHSRYLEAHVTGERTQENGVRFLTGVYEELAASGLRRVLLDVGFTGAFSPGNILQVIERTRFEGSQVERVGYTERNLPPKEARVVEVMARNRGMNARYFPTREAAIEWLLAP